MKALAFCGSSDSVGFHEHCEPRFFRPASFPRLLRPVPLISSEVCAGFPSPADDHIEGEFDLQELLIKNPPATFLIRVAGESMRDVQICPGDLLVVDRSREARDGSIVVACLDGEFTVKRLRKKGKRVWLQPENGEFPVIDIDAEREFQVWGVVTARITALKS
jgi:DNA polymerase V